jgi:hypothetical protein
MTRRRRAASENLPLYASAVSAVTQDRGKLLNVSERTLLLGLHRLGVAQNTPYASKGPYNPNLPLLPLILLVCDTSFLGTKPKLGC